MKYEMNNNDKKMKVKITIEQLEYIYQMKRAKLTATILQL